MDYFNQCLYHEIFLIMAAFDILFVQKYGSVIIFRQFLKLCRLSETDPKLRHISNGVVSYPMYLKYLIPLIT